MQKEWKEVYQKQNWGNKYPNEKLVQFIAWNYRDKNKSEMKVLDAGCGNGTNTLFLAEQGFQIDGFDGSEDAIQVAKEKLEFYGYLEEAKRLIVSDAKKLKYAPNTFDLITDISMLPYFETNGIISVLKEYYKILKSDGILYCTGLHEKDGVYGLDTALIKEENRVGKIAEGRLKGEYTHYFFTQESLQDFFKQAGFTKLEINHFQEEYQNKKLRYSYFSVMAIK